MPRLILAALLFLAACLPAQTRLTGFRPAGAPIWSAAAFDPARIEGRWQQVAAFTEANKAKGCKDGQAEFRRAPGGLAINADLCLNGARVRVAGPVALTGPGRLAVPGMAEWWVLWVDSGYRTLAIGTPDGRFGLVLDRGRIGADRLNAAAEIFDFNGYATARLTAF